MGISKHDKQALADLFIHMGVPLVVAIQTLESWSGGEAEPQTQRAEKLAKLLNISVDFATRLTKKLEIRDAYTLENVRGRIIRIVTPVIADYYIKNGEAPTTDDLQGLTDLFDVLLSFADSVSPTDEKGSKPTKIAAMVEACDPLLAVVRENSLSKEEGEIFQESVSGLKTRAEQLAQTLGQDHAIESGLFRSLVHIYVSCYRLVAERGGEIEDVWNECDQRLVLIHGLTVFVADNTGIQKGEESSSASKEKEGEEADTKEQTSEENKPDIFKMNTTDDKDETPQASSKDKKKTKEEGEDGEGEFNPMAFFSS